MAILKICVSQWAASKRDISSRVVVVDLRIVPLSSAIRGVQIETLAPSKVVLGIQAVPSALVVGNLHTVVLGGTLVGCRDYVANIREGAGKRSELVAGRSRRTDSFGILRR